MGLIETWREGGIEEEDDWALLGISGDCGLDQMAMVRISYVQ